VFVIQEDGSLRELRAAEFVKEKDFQDLLESYPDLLCGGLINPDRPRKWILVKREFGVPAEEDGSDIWSADHVFLDQDGVLTIVEVKRQSDSRIRREVVAQMLDYAANGVIYCKVDTIRSRFESTCGETGKDPDQELRDQFGSELDPSHFWEMVKTNLEAQKLRLLFVADVIPKELRRIVEFLNRQMTPVEVLALELKRYTGNGINTLAPTLFGQTEAARSVKSVGPSRRWDEATFFDELRSRSSDSSVKTASQILAWMKKNLDHPIFGTGKVDGSITAYRYARDGKKIYPLMLSTQNKVYVEFGYCLKHAPFDQIEKRREWLDKLNELPNVHISAEAIDRFPWISLSNLESDTSLKIFLDAMDWFIEEFAAAQALEAKAG
jgi:hypothetical protein